jgi:hypothetical protein
MTFWTPPKGLQKTNCGYHTADSLAMAPKTPSQASVEQALRDVAADRWNASSLIGAAGTDDRVMDAMWSKISSEDAKKCFVKASELRKSRGGGNWRPSPMPITDLPGPQAPQHRSHRSHWSLLRFPQSFLHIWVVTALVTGGHMWS